MSGIYSFPVAGATFGKFCGGNLGGEHESCVEFAEIPGAAAAYVLQDTKSEGQGRELRFTGAELDQFALGWARQRGLAL
ncbi:DUF397 domain-containing protein [Streptomyces pathocidini]|uniref:DUF397 domain-containing protein n=1 Tax=Streptomyces pathocidini TaxID=1650571 RepID=UPI0033D0BE5A